LRGSIQGIADDAAKGARAVGADAGDVHVAGALQPLRVCGRPRAGLLRERARGSSAEGKHRGACGEASGGCVHATREVHESCAWRAEGTEVDRRARVLSLTPRQSRRFTALALAIAMPTARAVGQRVTASDMVPCSASLATAPSTSNRDSSASRPASDSTKPADVVIYAAATAREVTFRSQPELHVRLCGGLDSIHVLDRRNLPSPVVVGTTYRDVYVAVQIFGRLNAECIRQTLSGRRAAADSTSRTPRLDCASLELRGTSSRSRAPNDSTHPPRR
jgi:hypothetical protein